MHNVHYTKTECGNEPLQNFDLQKSTKLIFLLDNTKDHLLLLITLYYSYTHSYFKTVFISLLVFCTNLFIFHFHPFSMDLLTYSYSFKKASKKILLNMFHFPSSMFYYSAHLLGTLKQFNLIYPVSSYTLKALSTFNQCDRTHAHQPQNEQYEVQLTL